MRAVRSAQVGRTLTEHPDFQTGRMYTGPGPNRYTSTRYSERCVSHVQRTPGWKRHAVTGQAIHAFASIGVSVVRGEAPAAAGIASEEITMRVN